MNEQEAQVGLYIYLSKSSQSRSDVVTERSYLNEHKCQINIW